MRDIIIQPAVNGWIVRVGCQTVVFKDLDAMLMELGNYINNPKATEERYLANAKNKDVRLDPEAPQVARDLR